jgi:hypothetical protein
MEDGDLNQVPSISPAPTALHDHPQDAAHLINGLHFERPTA